MGRLLALEPISVSISQPPEVLLKLVASASLPTCVEGVGGADGWGNPREPPVSKMSRGLGLADADADADAVAWMGQPS